MDAVLDDTLFDMVNLPAADTGVTGVVYVSTAQGSHGPRVKWFPGRPGRDLPSLSVTIDVIPRVINHGLPEREARQAGEAVSAWVVLNRTSLISFWNDGLGWTRTEVNAFFEGLAKLP